MKARGVDNPSLGWTFTYTVFRDVVHIWANVTHDIPILFIKRAPGPQAKNVLMAMDTHPPFKMRCQKNSSLKFKTIHYTLILRIKSYLQKPTHERFSFVLHCVIYDKIIKMRQKLFIIKIG